MPTKKTFRDQRLSFAYLLLTGAFALPAEAALEVRHEIVYELIQLQKEKRLADQEKATQEVLERFNYGRSPAIDYGTKPVTVAAPDAVPDRIRTPLAVAVNRMPRTEGREPKTALAAAGSRPTKQTKNASATPFKSVPILGAEQFIAPKGGERNVPKPKLRKLANFETGAIEFSVPSETPLIFDIPVTYNDRVKFWIKHYQTSGRNYFRTWLERSGRYAPIMQAELSRAGLPLDLLYVAMVESGFSSVAVSHASAMGMWQFIAPTANRYGLRTDWWIDERRDFYKSTRAAIGYMTDLHKMFGSWYLVAASYNMGENGVKRLIKKHGTNNFWKLADLGALPDETKNYVPKIIAAMLIAKAPALYGFRNLQYQVPQAYEYFHVPGGTDLASLSRYLGVSEKYLRELNPELVRGFVPREITGHKIRIPKGSMMTVSQYVRSKMEIVKN